MTERDTIERITGRLEQRLAARMVDQIRPLLAGRPVEVQTAVLSALVDELLAKFPDCAAIQGEDR